MSRKSPNEHRDAASSDVSKCDEPSPQTKFTAPSHTTIGGYEAPEGQIERALAHLWQELLGVDQVSRSDNFFELGGNSLLAVKLLQRMREENLLVKVRTLFVSPSLAALAEGVTEVVEVRL
ncbi:phosphopantetheine-binding protein [Agrobacterium leguminum]|uniref:Carrier domain-containing protein n=1 Tax=Agrobacterium deltaense NCPPB 1641 TaxID=1183425 RepID=A0A1S7TST9_9HYPH|nr:MULTISPECIES: phosphopantetheine-binding protein [Agrobacterium]WFS69306.1 phosphopantetheine-binding protein [Agrobacterium leguminum]CVI57347.1 hypothetical protein AGR7A_Lc10042 [Agrobacterium deltaense NCPPB 1641]